MTLALITESVVVPKSTCERQCFQLCNIIIYCLLLEPDSLLKKKETTNKQKVSNFLWSHFFWGHSTHKKPSLAAVMGPSDKSFTLISLSFVSVKQWNRFTFVFSYSSAMVSCMYKVNSSFYCFQLLPGSLTGNQNIQGDQVPPWYLFSLLYRWYLNHIFTVVLTRCRVSCTECCAIIEGLHVDHKNLDLYMKCHVLKCRCL